MIKCDNCRFVFRNAEGVPISCRRRPPVFLHLVPSLVPGGKPKQLWGVPAIGPDFECGDGKPEESEVQP